MSFRKGTEEGLEPGIRAAANWVLDNFAGELLIYCTFRSMEAQAILYRKGRSLAEILAKADEMDAFGTGDILRNAPPQADRKIVTKAGPGQSAHNYGLAFDAVPLDQGKPMWSLYHPLYRLYGRLSIEAGLDWAGRWRSFREGPHSQVQRFSWRESIQRR